MKMKSKKEFTAKSVFLTIQTMKNVLEIKQQETGTDSFYIWLV